MAKQEPRSAKPGQARAGQARPVGRRAGEAEPAAVPGPARRAELSRLAAEVERLQAELVATRAQVKELEAKVDIDPLLGILNRRGFERELSRSLAYVKRYGTPAALLYLDLDGFKPVNDRHGHAAGDLLLQAVVATLKRSVRASDIVARLGGDEFGLILWNLSEADARTKAEALETAVAATQITIGDAVLSVGASVGAAPLGALDGPADVLAHADQAMYARKAQRSRRI
jgi:diguanylate cyclase (GGDEF)-like protein